MEQTQTKPRRRRATTPQTCRLSLKIGDTTYGVRIKQPAPGPYAAPIVITLRKDRATVRTVTFSARTGATQCDCPARQFQPGPCKHIRALRAQNLIYVISSRGQR